ncbi:MAG: hypothetical protein WCE50_01805, partial [Candidatus Acidiferrum sp.]
RLPLFKHSNNQTRISWAVRTKEFTSPQMPVKSDLAAPFAAECRRRGSRQSASSEIVLDFASVIAL